MQYKLKQININILIQIIYIKLNKNDNCTTTPITATTDFFSKCDRKLFRKPISKIHEKKCSLRQIWVKFLNFKINNNKNIGKNSKSVRVLILGCWN